MEKENINVCNMVLSIPKKEEIITLVKNTIYNIDSETQVQSLLTLGL
jgi:hypothetical protein